MAWTKEFDGGNTPDAGTGAYDWVVFENYTGTPTNSSASGIFTFDSIATEGANYWYWAYRQTTAIDMAAGVTIETKLKVDSSTPANSDASIGTDINDAANKKAMICWEKGRIFMRESATGTTEYSMDTTDNYHVYRITISGTALKVYVDGTLRIDCTMTQAGGADFIQWNDMGGNANGGAKFLMDYYNYELGAARPPSTSWTLSLSDAFGMTDSKVGSDRVDKADSFSFSDAKIGSVKTYRTDTMNLADAKGSSFRTYRTDSLTFSDLKFTSIRPNKVESFSLTDSFSRQVSFIRTPTDTLDITDSNSRLTTWFRSLVDSFNISDANGKAFRTSRSDTLSIIDSLSRATTYLRSLSDTFSITDSLVTKLILQLILSDTFLMTDSNSFKKKMVESEDWSFKKEGTEDWSKNSNPTDIWSKESSNTGIWSKSNSPSGTWVKNTTTGTWTKVS